MPYKFFWPVLWEYSGLLWEGLLITLRLFGICTGLSLALGTLLGVLASSSRGWHRVFAEVYVEVNRNVPIVVQLFFLYFGFGLEAFTAAVIGLALHQSAYIAEVVRSGIQSIPRAQFEAGLSTGLSTVGVFRHVILPQAFIIVIPPLTTQIIEVLKNSSIAMTITVTELTFQSQQIEAITFRGFEAATAVTVAYLLMAVAIASVMYGIAWWIGTRRRGVMELWQRGRQLAAETATLGG